MDRPSTSSRLGELVAPDDAADEVPTIETPITLLILRVGASWLALEAEGVDEIITPGDVTPVPGLSPVVPGLLEVRGNAVPLLDLALFLSVPPGDAPLDRERRRVAVVRHAGMRVGLDCHQIYGVEDIEHSRVQAPEATNGQALRALYVGQLNHPRLGPVTVLDLPQLLEAAREQVR